MTVWSGGNASGKSTLVSQIGLAAVTEGFKVAMFSGEMTASRVREWVLLQAAGPDFVMQDPLNQNHYCLKPGIEEKLDAMLTGKLSIYDNDFGTDWEVVTNTIYDWVKKNEALEDQERYAAYLTQLSQRGWHGEKASYQKEAEQCQHRMTELNVVMKRLYEDNVFGRISDERFASMSADYEAEARKLKERLEMLDELLASYTKQNRDAKRLPAW